MTREPASEQRETDRPAMAEAIDSTLDVVIIGAGLSGINAAYRLQTETPHLHFTILESRHEIGGTWAFWKYPGARTDSGMRLFGFYWHTWPHTSNMAEAPVIKQYMEEAAAAQGIDKKIRFRHRVESASWSSEEQRWTLQVDVTGEDGVVERKVIKTWWLFGASGYYSYEKALPAEIPGIDRFGGEVVHPQFWDDSISYEGKKVVIIGSGATAVTLVPALAEKAASVTMLQRSPSYIFSLPRAIPIPFFAKFLPTSWSDCLRWWQRMLIETLFVEWLYAFPNRGRKLITKTMRQQLPKDFDVDKHFNPRYNPFEQRLCFSPGGDFFKAIRKYGAQVVTDIIDTVTETGIHLKSGETLDADMIITATGLYIGVFNSLDVFVDGVRINDTIGQRYFWNAVMVEGIPNVGVITGYTAATWTPGADARTQKLIRVVKHMEKTKATTATPVLSEEERAKFPKRPAFNLSSTYVTAALDRLPMDAGVRPWAAGRNWITDWWRLVTGSVTDGMRYTFGGRSKSD